MKNKIEYIKKLSKDKNAIILAHNYQSPEIQDIADICGDSLELSIKASNTKADIIVFCGVHFMAETAYILSPEKTVLLPAINATCPMADMVTDLDLKKFKEQNKEFKIITYVNSSAKVKAVSDICCTSANAVNVASSIEEENILMVPDKNLANYVKTEVKDKNIQFWDGFCPFHNNLSKDDVIDAKSKNPDALLLAHPECKKEVLDLADEIKSTSGMLNFAEKSSHNKFIIATEVGLLHSLRKKMPQKEFYSASDKLLCPDMKKITLDSIIRSLETLEGKVVVEEKVRVLAFKSVQKMIKGGIPK